MAKSSLSPASEYLGEFDRKEILHKNHYFDNETVERLMYLYVEGACTDVPLRDEIMVWASELIRQLIKAHNLGQICPGKDDTSVYDLFQTAWLQIEGALYKYEARPHCNICYNNLRPNDSLLVDEFWFASEVIRKIKKCKKCDVSITEDSIYYKGKSKIFNMWSQIARTVGLAYIKKENRDRKNSNIFQSHLENRQITKNHVMDRFLTEAREILKYNDSHLHLLNVIEKLYEEDEKPHEGLIGKLVERSKLPRTTITGFLWMMRLRSKDFSDSPVNEEHDTLKDRMDKKEKEFE